MMQTANVAFDEAAPIAESLASGLELLSSAKRAASPVLAEFLAAFFGAGKFWGVIRKAPRCGALHPIDEDINRVIAKVRARVELPFRVIKRQVGYLKTRYRGLARNRTQLFTLFALRNLFLVRQRLLA
jgi:hypothetical protein